MQLNNCDIYQLKKSAKAKKLVCFGAGKEFIDFLRDYESLHLEEDIYAVADNSMEKKGTLLSVAGVSIPIISVEQLFGIQNMILLISCADIGGVLEQLEKYSELEAAECFAVHFVRSRTNRLEESKRLYPATFRLTDTARIPKKIHYCWFGKKEIPEKNLAWMESWKKYCPDYEIIRWDESNYDVSKNKYMYEAYQQQRWGFVSDYARIDIVYHQGGIYLDTDVELIRNWDDLLYQDAFMGMEATLRIALGLGFGSAQHFPLWKELLELYDGTRFLNEDGTENRIPCPQFQDEVYVRNGYVHNGRYQKVCGALVYPETVFSPKDLYTGETVITPHTYSIHHYDGSWIDERQMAKDIARRELFRKFDNP